MNIDDYMELMKKFCPIYSPELDDKYSDLEIGDSYIAGYIDNIEIKQKNEGK